MRIAFSTVACPEWPMGRVVAMAEELGYDGVELRTFGEGSTRFACDPALTCRDKLREMYVGTSVEPACVATGLRLDQQVWPPVIGRAICDNECAVREVKWAIGLAAEIGSPFVRVFGFQAGRGEKIARVTARIRERLELVVAAARNTGVRVLVENGGTFATGEAVRGLIEGLDTRYVGVSYNMCVGHRAGDDVVGTIESFGDLVSVVKFNDERDGEACLPGEGEVPCAEVVSMLGETGYAGWLTFEWDRAWVAGLAAPEAALGGAIRAIYGWRGGDGGDVSGASAVEAALV